MSITAILQIICLISCYVRKFHHELGYGNNTFDMQGNYLVKQIEITAIARYKFCIVHRMFLQ